MSDHNYIPDCTISHRIVKSPHYETEPTHYTAAKSSFKHCERKKENLFAQHTNPRSTAAQPTTRFLSQTDQQQKRAYGMFRSISPCSHHRARNSSQLPPSTADAQFKLFIPLIRYSLHEKSDHKTQRGCASTRSPPPNPRFHVTEPSAKRRKDRA
jgi:hypothetical protein